MDFLPLVITPAVILFAWITGSIIERRHLRGLLLLEDVSRDLMVLTIEDLPPGWEVESCDLVMGNVVISQDYFKRVAAGIKGVFGGNIGVLEPLLERARREAIIRMKAEAAHRGHDTVINVRMETATLASAGSNRKGVAGVEILAFGTAISLKTGRRMFPRPAV